jgi:hypothetical protein
MNDSGEQPQPRGCLFRGCMIAAVLALVLALLGYLTVRTIANRVNAFIAENTDAQPMEFPKSDVAADELQALEERVTAFNTATGTNAPALRLTGRELNALLADSAEMQHMKNWFYVALDGDQIKGRVSLPLESQFKVPLLHFKGRYLNGAGTFPVAVSNQMLFVGIQTLEVKGKPLPEKFMKRLQEINFAENFNNSTNRAAIANYGSVTVKDGVMVITTKSGK